LLVRISLISPGFQLSLERREKCFSGLALRQANLRPKKCPRRQGPRGIWRAPCERLYFFIGEMGMHSTPFGERTILSDFIMELSFMSRATVPLGQSFGPLGVLSLVPLGKGVVCAMASDELRAMTAMESSLYEVMV